MDAENPENLDDETAVAQEKPELVDVKEIDRIQDDLNLQLDQLADRIENIVSIYVAARKREAGEAAENSDENLVAEAA